MSFCSARLAQEIPDSMKKSNKMTKQPKKDPLAGLPIEKRAAIVVTKELYQKWEKPINALEKVHHLDHSWNSLCFVKGWSSF